MKIATWNVNSIKVRLEHVQQWCEANPVDVLCLQETKSTDDNFPLEAFSDMGFYPYFTGQKTYNGVAIMTREKVKRLETALPDMGDEAKRFIALETQDTWVVNVYVPNGQSVGSDKYIYKLDFLSHLEQYLKDKLVDKKRLIVVGDFNIAPADQDVYDPKAWKDAILCSEQERAAFNKLLATGLHDCVRMQHSDKPMFSWWDYRQAAFQRDRGLRIDHILASDALVNTMKVATVDATPRAWERPSDHAPVVAEFD